LLAIENHYQQDLNHKNKACGGRQAKFSFHSPFVGKKAKWVPPPLGFYLPNIP
jgi:hypothetical protein